ncbi:hypothetical protein C942_04698 [Photobacterium marinum]|uniref:Uncharacterized protein n=1 Tax=Photobacterium marinum TaxID=1056511 RepID=L8JHI3_9GAMM|nr:hypothetical protein C942_04698 [Photobacterium marinum]
MFLIAIDNGTGHDASNNKNEGVKFTLTGFSIKEEPTQRSINQHHDEKTGCK